MARPHLLLVDADPRTVRVLEVNLKNDGFSVTTATDGAEALTKLEFTLPDVLVAETRLPRVDGLELVRRLRALPGGEQVAVVLVAPESVPRGPQGISASAADQLRAIELGVSDCLTKPVSVRELVTRVNLMLARRTRALLTSGGLDQTQFSGHLQDIGVIDLLQSFEAGRRSGVLQIEHGSRRATVLFDNGKVVDAEQGQLRGEEALYRTFLWTTGVFDIEFVDVEVADNISIGTPALLMEGMRRIDEWGRLAEQLPSSTSVFTVDADILLERLAEVPDELNPVLRLFDGERTLMGVIDESPFDDLSTLSVVSKLYFEGVLRVLEPEPASRLGAGRILGPVTTKGGGNVVRLPHVANDEVVVQVRPHAPDMTPDPLPRSLVYSEPPQNLRMSQRAPAANRVAGSTLIGIPAILSSGGNAEAPTRATNAEESSRVVPSPTAHAPVPPATSAAHSPLVSEAEYEDVTQGQPSEESPDATRASASKGASPEPSAVTTPAKPKEPLEHDFFSVGDEGTYEGGPSSAELHEQGERVSSTGEVELDPRVLAALQARRQQSRRWVTWIFGVALLLLLWGVITVAGNSEDEAAAPLTANSAALSSLPAPAPTETQAEVVQPTPPASTGDLFEDVAPSPAATTATWGPLGSGKSLSAPAPSTLGPRGPASPSRSKKPPTARFPSTPDHQ